MTPRLVLLPGLDGTGDLFAPFISELGSSPETKVVRYPSDGCPDYASCEAAARLALPRIGSYVLLGESFSGPVAIRIAASKPAGLSGLILCASFARNPRPALRRFRALLRRVPRRHPPNWLVSSLVLGSASTPVLTSMLVRSLKQTAPEILLSRALAVLDVDAARELADVKVPILYLKARRDRLVPVAAYQEILAIARQVSVVDIDAPHFVLQVAPKEAVDSIRGFFGSLEARP